MNQQGIFGLSELRSDEDALKQSEKINAYIHQNGDFVKANAQKFLDTAHSHLMSPQTSPISKVMTLHVFKELTYRVQTKLFSLMSLHKILNYFQTEAKTVDPRKPIHEKGGKRFPESPDIGREYMRVLLELIQIWGQKFAKGKNSEATKFKKNLIDLKNQGVIMPEEYVYIDPSQIKSKAKKVSKDATVLASSQKTVEEKKQTPSGSGQSGSGGSLRSQMKFTGDKITLFLDQLEQEQDVDKINQSIVKNHDFFNRQSNKYREKMSTVENQNFSDEQLGYFFKITQFLEMEGRIYDQHILARQDVQSYITELKMANEKLGSFQQSPFDSNSNPNKPAPPSAAINRRQPNAQSQMQMNEARTKKQEKPSYNNTQPSNDVKLTKKNILDSVYERFADRSKSPDIGFKNVQKQLQKEKEIAKKNPLRNTSRSPKPNNRSGLGASRSTTNLKESKVSPIFTNPPNPRIEPKNFEGQLVPFNRELGKAVFNIKKHQGIKRFKTSNFKDRSPLFENDHIQVGFKSQSLYQSINGFTHFIFLNLFVGNKTDQVVKDFQVQYKGDPNQLLYANPRSVDSLIPAGYQNKHDLLITPLRLPYCLLTMHISYKFQNSQVMTSIVLPNSILKFATYMRISKQQLWQSWKDSDKYKTDAFQLCTSLPPDSFNKYIPALEYLTEYSQFAAMNSQTDLQMFCKIIMLQKYEAILKIIVRPNLNVVLQLGSLENSRQAAEYFTFYLESLQLIMKEISI